MKDKFQSKAVPRGTRTIWRYLSALFILFTFAIGNVWGADETINLYYGTSKAVDGDNLNTEDFFFSGHTSNTGKSAVEIGGTSFTHYLTMSGYGASAINTDPAKLILYYPKKSTTTFTVYVQNKYNGNKKYYIDHLFEGETVVSDRKYQKQLAKDGTEKHEYTFTNADKKNAVIALMPSQTMYIYQITVTESGDDLKQAGDNGYSFNTYRAGALAEAEVKVDGLSIKPSSKLNVGASYFKIRQSSTYAKFTLSQKTLVTVGVNNSRKFIFCAAATPTDAEKADKKGTGSAGNVQTALTAGTWYLESESTSELQISNISFSVPTISYDANGGEGSMSSNTWTVAANGFTAPSGKKFDGWKDGDDNVYTVGQEVLEDVTLYAQWKDDVAEYTVTYKDGTTELKSVNVAVGSAPDAYSPTKEFYTFAAWQKNAADYDPADLASDAAANDEITLTARWTAQYTSGTYEFTGNLTMGTDPQMTIEDNVSGNPYSAGRIDNIYVSAQTIGYEATGDYGGWKLKTTNGTLRFLVENTCGIRVTIGEANPLRINYTEGGTAKSADIAKSTTSAIYKADANSLVTLTNFTANNKTVTLKKIEVLPLYTATRVDGKSDASGPDANVLETTLPTPTAVSGWTFTGWIANQDVKDGDETKTASTILPAGTYTLLANTTFTAQWMEVTGTYDITYVSAHGTAPDAENAASVVLAELSEEGWAHKGWTANADVTVDAATVEAGTLIANGKTAILASNVTFTAVWKEIFTVTFDSKDGSAVAPIDVEDGATLAAAPSAPTKDNYVFQGWSETDGGSVVADITAITISDDKTFYAIWALDVQVSEIVFSNSFKGWIHDGQIEVFYMAGESAPTIVSYDGKNLKAEGAVVISGDKVIATGTDDSEKEYDLAMTAVTPLTATGAQTFDGTEGYVKTRHAWTAERKWKMSKYAEDGRVARGETSMYIFLGAAESVTFDWGKQQKTNDVAVYVNGTFVKNLGNGNNSAVELTNGNNMVAFYSLQTSGDVWLNGLTTTPWVPVTAVTLKEGEAEISSKEIWASTNFTLTAEVTPDNASNKTITWTSSDPTVATVADGVVTGVAASADPVTITASTVDGVTATCEVTVTVAPEPSAAPTITTQPATQAYCAGSEPTLTVAAEVNDGGTLHYAWTKDDAAIGTDAATCVVDGAGTYKVVVTNHVDGKLDASTTSNEAVITLNVAAAITTQPTGKSDVVSGSEVTLSVVATNATGYQWYICDDAEKANASAISGAESADYVFNCSANAYYYCVVGNACGADVESNVVLVKLEPAGCNLIASIPDAEPYQYVQTGEWTLYGIDSNGKLATSNKFKNNAKDFDDNTVNAIEDQRVGMIFDKDIESLTIYATATSTGRTWKSDQKIRVTSDDITSGSPSYSNVTATRAVTTMPANNKQYIFTADNMLIEAGKKVWLPFSGTVTIFKICYTAAPEKCEAPALPTLSSKELCAGDAFTSWDATSTVSDGGTLSYQWYNGDTDAALSGEDDAEFTPSADGNYYVIVTNKKAGYRDNTTKSATLSVEHFTGTAITEGLVDLRGAVDDVVTLEVIASGKNLHYAWKESATIDGTYTDVAGAADAASLDVTITAGMDKYYKVVVTSDCGSAQESVANVTQFVPVSQADVTGSIAWNWANAASVNEIKLTDSTTPKKNQGFVMANGAATIYNNANFESDKLYLEGEYIVRDGKYFQGQTIKFNTTVAGVVRVKFSHTGNATAEKPARELYVNGVATGDVRNSATAAWSRYVEVPAGEVVITAYYVDLTPAAAQQYIRVSEIEFLEKIDSRTGYAANDLGTACYEYDAVVIGATPYMVAGVNGNGYIVFDEITSGVIDAGKPYLFEADGGQIFFCKPIGVTAAPLTSGDEITVKGMVGTFSGTTLTQGEDDICYFAGRHIWRVNDFSVDIDVDPHRCYVNYDVLKAAGPASAPAAGRRRVTMGVNGKDATQGFENILGGDQPMKVMIDGTLYIIRGEKVFDATGRLVK